MAWVISSTGWTWEYVEDNVTLPKLAILDKFWQQIPPTSLQLKRISIALGLPVSASAQHSGNAIEATDEELQKAMASGIPVYDGKPDDPYLDFLDLPK